MGENRGPWAFGTVGLTERARGAGSQGPPSVARGEARPPPDRSCEEDGDSNRNVATIRLAPSSRKPPKSNGFLKHRHVSPSREKEVWRQAAQGFNFDSVIVPVLSRHSTIFTVVFYGG